ncbi:hypothetical protein [Pseudomonas sp. Q2-TVG4-2]|uniref:hypothetical protein n=1 Tax=Pseudomonas sp. Q2-TVG4-2 TaxID=1685699 RepID=UPI0015E7BACA|nr:hypothetical protein [Pseudomonas sp. Q2-TVG4-2]
MTDLKRYRIHYLINGNPASLTLSSFEEPDIEQAELEILLHHVREPRAATDAPWENPERPSEDSRIAELGVSDIQIEEEPSR